jgi:hypothetical protein
MLLLIAVVAVLLGLILSWGPRKIALEVGHVDIPLDFVIIDAGSGQAIAGASILLQDPDYNGLPPQSPYTLAANSGSDGHYRVLLKELMYSASCSITEDGRFLKCLSRGVRYPNWELHVSADGYKKLSVSWQDFRMRYIGDRRYHEDQVPPPIVVRLRRQPQAVLPQ